MNILPETEKSSSAITFLKAFLWFRDQNFFLWSYWSFKVI